MKQVFILIIIIFTGASMLSSCSKSSSGKSLVGNWKMVSENDASVNSFVVPIDTIFNNVSYAGGSGPLLQLNTDYSYLLSDTVGTTLDSGRYVIYGDALIINSVYKANADTNIYKITGKTLTLNYEYSNTGQYQHITQTFTREQ